MKKGSSDQLTPAQQAELEALAALPDDQIYTRDMPEVRDWSGAQRGLFFRPIKLQLTLRIDADVIAWFKRQTPHGQGYQTLINRALREYVEQHTHGLPTGRKETTACVTRMLSFSALSLALMKWTRPCADRR